MKLSEGGQWLCEHQVSCGEVKRFRLVGFWLLWVMNATKGKWFWEGLERIKTGRWINYCYVGLLREEVEKFGRVCEGRKVKVITGKSKLLKCSASGEQEPLSDTGVGGVWGERVRIFGIHGFYGWQYGGRKQTQTWEGVRIMGGLASMWRDKEMTTDEKIEIFESIVVPIVLYES